MENHTEIKKVKDQIEGLIMEIILSVLVRLKNEIVLEKKNEMKFWASGETESGSAGEQLDKG